ncbi:Hypothetical predicted protein [Mytilus galloprovincialis]|uniref:Uncharacterized protein n=1 Tax=Mytilus galloprovincialis TaxID=29158 RepID=A0A8B6E4D3_MYTGA|nr:Hypothetical predicted protein [Mytilus galloprovincialis]
MAVVEQNIKNHSFQQIVNVPFPQVAEILWIHQRKKIRQKPVSNKKNDRNIYASYERNGKLSTRSSTICRSQVRNTRQDRRQIAIMNFEHFQNV